MIEYIAFAVAGTFVIGIVVCSIIAENLAEKPKPTAVRKTSQPQRRRSPTYRVHPGVAPASRTSQTLADAYARKTGLLHKTGRRSSRIS